jgi:alanyl-tRNA synthetase
MITISMKSREIRQLFFDFFAEKGHTILRSAPVIPADDPTLLFTNAGMNQFKDVFLGKGTRPYTRAADTQKCIRASGKHNDLEDVGRDTYHHTFFEMLGNWSFGDYYKEEAISWAWELFVGVWKLPKERLYATVFREDDESLKIWQKHTDIDPSHILLFGEKDNFWEMGETGPCGPCSEIHIDLTPDCSGGKLVNAGDYRVIELWNLVFIQYNRQSDGRLEPLPQKHVDTGMGFERITAVLQGKNSNYDTDVFRPLFDRITEITGVPYGATLDGQTDIAMRVIADHARTLTFALSDGAMPSNEGRGYVLRRILRRALRYSKNLGCHEPIINQLVATLADSMGDVFPELRKQQETVSKIIKAEEESFIVTLDRGIEIFNEVIENVRASGKTVISGEDAFKLYDTYGFPFDLTRLMAADVGFQVDGEGFEHSMQEQKLRARTDRREKQQVHDDAAEWQWFREKHQTAFDGYERLEMPVSVIGAKHSHGKLLLVLDRTPFYAESGGQVGDRGWIETSVYRLHVTDTIKDGDSFLHVVTEAFDKILDTAVNPGDITLDDSQLSAEASVDRHLRQETERNHTATHLLHGALRSILGQHVQQKGSFVNAERLRFDFSHFSRLSESEIEEVESLVNEQIRKARAVTRHADVPYDEAIAKGALAFFGDKYTDLVRVIEIPDISVELCGGTHVDNIGRIGLFKIISESSVASGVRRIEALTGKAAERFLWKEHRELQEVRNLLKAKGDESVADKLSVLVESRKVLEKQLQEHRMQKLLENVEAILAEAKEEKGVSVLTHHVAGVTADELRMIGQALLEKLKHRGEPGTGLLSSVDDGKVSLVSYANNEPSFTHRFDSGSLIREAAKYVQGGGGGKPELATAGGKDPSGEGKAFDAFRTAVKKQLGD